MCTRAGAGAQRVYMQCAFFREELTICVAEATQRLFSAQASTCVPLVTRINSPTHGLQSKPVREATGHSMYVARTLPPSFVFPITLKLAYAAPSVGSNEGRWFQTGDFWNGTQLRCAGW